MTAQPLGGGPVIAQAPKGSPVAAESCSARAPWLVETAEHGAVMTGGHLRALRAALEVDEGGALLGVRRARQHDVRARSAPVPVVSLK